MGNSVCTSYGTDRPRTFILRHQYPRSRPHYSEEQPRVDKVIKGLNEFLKEQQRMEKDRKDQAKYRCRRQHVDDIPPGTLPLLSPSGLSLAP